MMTNLEKDFPELYNVFRRGEERDALKPAAIDIQKRKFLAALSKTKISLSEEEDKLAEKAFKEDCWSMTPQLQVRQPPVHWTDTFGTEEIKNIITKHQNFDITLYLNSAKVIFLAYSGKIRTDRSIYEAYTYVLTHARTFGDLSKNLFQLEDKGETSDATSLTLKFAEGDLSRPLPDGVYMRKITNLIEDLHTSYDESEYRILNTNVTYLTLLMLRRSARSDTQFKDIFNYAKTHGDYVKLCPHPLQDQLPKVSDVFNSFMDQFAIKPPVILAIHAFLSGTDALTKKVLNATCVQYIEWTGFQLPALFFKVVQLYQIEEGQLWDSLLRVNRTEPQKNFRLCELSLYRLSKCYYEQFQRSIAEPPETSSWFPYCRALKDIFHNDLCGTDNRVACMILAYLVDLKLGFNKSFARNAHWTKKFLPQAQKDNMLEIAKQFSEEFLFA